MFRAQFPEFGGNVPDALITVMLGAAALELDTSVWGAFGVVGGNMTKSDQGQMYLAAHKLAVSPFGQNAKMASDPRRNGYDRTTYGAEFKLLMGGVTSGNRVA